MHGTVLGKEVSKGTPILAKLGWNLIAQQVWGGRTQNRPICTVWATWLFAPGSQHRGGPSTCWGRGYFHDIGLGSPNPFLPSTIAGVCSRSLRACQGLDTRPSHLEPLPRLPPVRRPRPASPISPRLSNFLSPPFLPLPRSLLSRSPASQQPAPSAFTAGVPSPLPLPSPAPALCFPAEYFLGC